MSGHKLVSKMIKSHGQTRTSWTCECGNWHPKPASQSPWGAGRPAPMETVINYIKRLHQEHADIAESTKEPK